jgi:hypothetical protein
MNSGSQNIFVYDENWNYKRSVTSRYVNKKFPSAIYMVQHIQ